MYLKIGLTVRAVFVIIKKKQDVFCLSAITVRVIHQILKKKIRFIYYTDL